MDNNLNSEKILKDVKNKNVNELISSLNENDKQMLDRLLKDEKAREKLLSSKEAQIIFNLLNKKDGK